MVFVVVAIGHNDHLRFLLDLCSSHSDNHRRHPSVVVVAERSVAAGGGGGGGAFGEIGVGVRVVVLHHYAFVDGDYAARMVGVGKSSGVVEVGWSSLGKKPMGRRLVVEGA